jgi:hypothetical protein
MILQKWTGPDFDRETRRGVADALFRHAQIELYHRNHAVARAAFATAAAHDAQLYRSVIARVSRLPFACQALRSLGLLTYGLLGKLELRTNPALSSS